MAGSHRAPAPERRSLLSARALVLTLVIAAVAAGVYALNRSNGADPDSAPRVPTPTVSIGTGTPSSPTVSTSPRPTPKRTAKPLPRVRPSAPRRLVVSGVLDVGFDDTVTPKNGVFSARSTAEIARWGGRGVPGNPAKDTVYLIGKVSSDGAFERLASLHRGSRVTLRTRTGVLTYTVRTAVAKPAKGLTRDASFKLAFPGRLQLVGIRYDRTGDRTGTILVVTAQLTGARRT